MSKSFWLLSAGFAALATPAYAQDDAAATAAGTEQAAVERRPKTSRTSSSPPRAAARSSRTFRSPCRRSAASSMQNSRRQRHPPAQPARPLAARLLDRHRGERLGPYPRHRHGRRQSRPRKLGRGVHRRRLPLAQRHRPQRARRGRADRGAARPAGHPVRPQRLGRPDPRHHPPARITSSAAMPRPPTAITTRSAPPARVNVPIGETLASRLDAVYMRRDGFYNVVDPQGGTEERRQRPRPPLRPRPAAVRAERRALVPADRRLYQPRGILLRRGLSRPRRPIRRSAI